MKILFVEDEELLRESVGGLLTDDGHEVVAVEDGVAALAELERDARFDAVVTDHRMPSMTGGELAAIVRERWGLPVVIATGYAKEVPIRRDVPIVRKPFSLHDLQLAIGVAAIAQRA